MPNQKQHQKQQEEIKSFLKLENKFSFLFNILNFPIDRDFV